jgi:hypothetical protein
MKHGIVFVLLLAALASFAGAALSMERTAVVIGSRVQIHEGPDGDSAVVGLVNEGGVVSVLGRGERPVKIGSFIDYWYRVSWRGKTGWIFGQFMALSSGGRGLARIFIADELVEYCARSAENLTNIEGAHAYAALVDNATLLLSDIDEMGADPILSAYGQKLVPYRLFTECLLGVGYAGTGATGDAKKIRDRLAVSDPATVLPDKTTLGEKIGEIDATIMNREAAPK